MQLTQSFIQHLEATTGYSLHAPQIEAISGGDINATYRLQTSSVSWFIKVNHAALEAMFAAEADGLKEWAATRLVRVPSVITYGHTLECAYLVLEYLPLTPCQPVSQRDFAQQLAQLHQHTKPFYGWHRNNTIGSTPQYNPHSTNWVEFWQQHRLGTQLKMAADKGYGGALQRQGEKLLADMGLFFTDYTPPPVLLHGDLWSGNIASDTQQHPVIFDPACYYGDRETDMAMTELFSGFSRDFYAAYQAIYPLDDGYCVRKNLYNLYHILNHLNLFGGGYLRRAETMIHDLLAHLAA
jgi:protein-ribulosamine 3-kinase